MNRENWRNREKKKYQREEKRKWQGEEQCDEEKGQKEKIKEKR